MASLVQQIARSQRGAFDMPILRARRKPVRRQIEAWFNEPRMPQQADNTAGAVRAP